MLIDRTATCRLQVKGKSARIRHREGDLSEEIAVNGHAIDQKRYLTEWLSVGADNRHPSLFVRCESRNCQDVSAFRDRMSRRHCLHERLKGRAARRCTDFLALGKAGNTYAGEA